MPRKPRITAVPVDQVEEVLGTPMGESKQEEVKTDAEQMTEVINEVKVSSEASTEAPESPPEPDPEYEAVTPKAKPKRASRAKPKVEEPLSPTTDDGFTNLGTTLNEDHGLATLVSTTNNSSSRSTNYHVLWTNWFLE